MEFEDVGSSRVARISSSIICPIRDQVWLSIQGFSLIPGTVNDLVLTGHGHLTERKTLALFGDSVIPCRHSGEKPFQRG